MNRYNESALTGNSRLSDQQRHREQFGWFGCCSSLWKLKSRWMRSREERTESGALTFGIRVSMQLKQCTRDKKNRARTPKCHLLWVAERSQKVGQFLLEPSNVTAPPWWHLSASCDSQAAIKPYSGSVFSVPQLNWGQLIKGLIIAGTSRCGGHPKGMLKTPEGGGSLVLIPFYCRSDQIGSIGAIHTLIKGSKGKHNANTGLYGIFHLWFRGGCSGGEGGFAEGEWAWIMEELPGNPALPQILAKCLPNNGSCLDVYNESDPRCPWVELCLSY